MSEEVEQRYCIDCGEPSTGLRCRDCHGIEMNRRALAETALRDASILEMVNVEHLSGQRLADRLGVSRPRASRLIKLARKREDQRVAAGGQA